MTYRPVGCAAGKNTHEEAYLPYFPAVSFRADYPAHHDDRPCFGGNGGGLAFGKSRVSQGENEHKISLFPPLSTHFSESEL